MPDRLPQWLSSKETACNAEDAGDPGWEDPLKEGMATHCSILAWRIHGQKSLVGYNPCGCKESNMTEATEDGGQRRLTQKSYPINFPLIMVILVIRFFFFLCNTVIMKKYIKRESCHQL